MECEPKRMVSIVLSDITKSNLYPDGKVYELVLSQKLRSGNVKTFRVSTENLDTVLDYIQLFLQGSVFWTQVQ